MAGKVAARKEVANAIYHYIFRLNLLLRAVLEEEGDAIRLHTKRVAIHFEKVKAALDVYDDYIPATNAPSDSPAN